MYIVYGHNRKRLQMDRSRYYSPEEMYNRAIRVSADGLFLEVVSNHYEKVKNNIELLFACKVVSCYHVSLHNDHEIDTRSVAEFLFMDTTTHVLATACAGEQLQPMNSNEDYEEDDQSGEFESPLARNIGNEFEDEGHENSPWNDPDLKCISAKRDRRNVNRHKSQHGTSPHAEILHEHEDMVGAREDLDDNSI